MITELKVFIDILMEDMQEANFDRGYLEVKERARSEIWTQRTLKM